MAFTIRDMHDMVRLLTQHPEWRADVRRLVLTEELLELPAIVRELATAQQRTEQRVEELVAAQQRTEQRVEELVVTQQRAGERLDRLETAVESLTVTVRELTASQARLEQSQARLEESQARLEQSQARLEESQARLEQSQARLEESQARLEESQARLEQSQARLEESQARLEIDVAAIKGTSLQQKYVLGAHGYFGRWLRRIRVILPGRLDTATEDRLEEHLSNDELNEVLRLDAIIRGLLRQSAEPDEVYLAMEISVVVDKNDIERAVRRAKLLRRAGFRTVPVVAGERLTEGAETQAETDPVVVVLNGREQGWEQALAVA